MCSQQKVFDYMRPGLYMAMGKCPGSFMISACIVGAGVEVRKHQARHAAGTADRQDKTGVIKIGGV